MSPLSPLFGSNSVQSGKSGARGPVSFIDSHLPGSPGRANSKVKLKSPGKRYDKGDNSFTLNLQSI
jgi:hypothetical protein